MPAHLIILLLFTGAFKDFTDKVSTPQQWPNHRAAKAMSWQRKAQFGRPFRPSITEKRIDGYRFSSSSSSFAFSLVRLMCRTRMCRQEYICALPSIVWQGKAQFGRKSIGYCLDLVAGGRRGTASTNVSALLRLASGDQTFFSTICLDISFNFDEYLLLERLNMNANNE